MKVLFSPFHGTPLHLQVNQLFSGKLHQIGWWTPLMCHLYILDLNSGLWFSCSWSTLAFSFLNASVHYGAEKFCHPFSGQSWFSLRPDQSPWGTPQYYDAAIPMLHSSDGNNQPTGFWIIPLPWRPVTYQKVILGHILDQGTFCSITQFGKL